MPLTSAALPKPPTKVPPKAAQAIRLYTRMFCRPDVRSLVGTGRLRAATRRLNARLEAMTPREQAAYYAGTRRAIQQEGE